MLYRPQVPKLRAVNARTGFLEPADFAAFCAELPAYLQPVARFAYLSGWRRGEVLGLQWRQVDVKSGTIRLDAAQSKNGEGRVLAFAPDSGLAEVLAEQAEARRLDCPYVFHRNGRRIRDFYTASRSAAKRVGWRGLMLHDFRRPTARNLVHAGVPERVATAITGHKTRAIFDRYNIIDERDLREASAKMSAYVADREPREWASCRAARIESGCRTYLTRLMPEVGLEPTRSCPHGILSPARLPFRHSGAWGGWPLVTVRPADVQGGRR
jgi:integrase